ncbi:MULTISPECIES: hypothetical protein [Pseudomonas syringae group]|uniref:Uncharacterized protein n=2 Tax=Pseudomonas syringae group TaxID=136849 RepID=A0AAW4DQH3_PSESX|nr:MULTISPECIES: hypothetical protein [Pseudomonas syringae group]AVI86043.1 hypothetical protein XJ28_21255 [Pseudomonas syringae pv. tomato]EEB59188.1 hypothetical protein PSPTOT1_4310 [Pseudomonas syringae pv. tomato T1]KGK94214.1 hypothetical protein NB04_17105 [Pseudomonas syringae pv. tomato]KTC04011.1 hypothetical protein AO386_17130 [Pseudomonas syringae ICMP 11292]KUR43172.1 hypothetical protein PSTA9_03206 [Pseudomonas syringae pv. tomato]
MYASAKLVSSVLDRYLIDEQNSLYQFEDSPILRLKTYNPDSNGESGYEFSLYDDTDIDRLLKGIPALSIVLRDEKVTFLKVDNFSFPGDSAEQFIYKGELPGGLVLGSNISKLLPLTDLDFDDALEWFYTDSKYGEIEIGGWGVPLEDEPDQIINSICIIPSQAPA